MRIAILLCLAIAPRTVAPQASEVRAPGGALVTGVVRDSITRKPLAGAFVQLVTPWFKVSRTYTWLELDGNKQTVSPSQQPRYVLQPGPCPHYAGADSLGDPFFNLANQRLSG